MGLVYALLHVLLPGLDATAPGAGLGAVAVLALVAIGVALAHAAVRGTHGWAGSRVEAGRRDALLRRSERAPVPPVRDPDAPGHPRPRAPGAATVAA